MHLMFQRFLRTMLLLLSFLAFLAGGLSAQTPTSGPPELFRDTLTTRSYAEEGATRQRNVTISQALLNGDDRNGVEPGAVTLNLFPNARYEARYLRTEPAFQNGYVVLYAIAGGSSYDYAAISVVGDAVSGTVRFGDDLYTIRHVGDGELTISQVDELQLAPCGGAFDPPPTQEIGPGQPGFSPRGMVSETIDLLIVYTTNTTAANGGHDGVASLANLSVFETNYAYANSDMLQRVNLVGTREVSYAQSGNQSTDLGRLRDTGDGFMDEVHGWRDDYGADYVDLFISGYGSGVAYVMRTESASFEANAFSVCRDTRAASSYTLAHELGHNMGCEHDLANGGSSPLFPYSYGWITGTQSYRSVMAYPPGTRIQVFSNPDKFAPDGQVMGAAGTADNSRCMDETVDTTALFRPTKETGHRVTTLFASNNGASGNMFDIKPYTDLELTGLSVNTSSIVAVSADVWWRDGSHAGNEGSSAGWTLLGTFNGTGQGTDNPTYISLAGAPEKVFEAGGTYGIFVDLGGAVRYTNGEGDYQNNFLRIESGVGKGAGGFAGGTFADRIWNGTLYYTAAAGTDSLSTTFAGGNGQSGNMFDVTAKDDVRVHGFTISTSGVDPFETLAVDVYMRNGSYVGFEDQMWEWTYVGTDYRSGSSIFASSSFNIEVGGIDLQEGQDYAFYVHVASNHLGHSLNYTNGANTYENTDLILETGVGKSSAVFTGSTFTPRTWNGTVWYTVDRPRLEVENIVAGQTGTIRTTNGTPLGRNFVSWSTGNGPINSQWGTVFLNSNYTTLPRIDLDIFGAGQILVPVQPNTTGITIYLQGLDVPSLQLTNPVAVTIQ